MLANARNLQNPLTFKGSCLFRQCTHRNSTKPPQRSCTTASAFHSPPARGSRAYGLAALLARSVRKRDIVSVPADRLSASCTLMAQAPPRKGARLCCMGGRTFLSTACDRWCRVSPSGKLAHFVRNWHRHPVALLLSINWPAGGF